MQAGSTLYEQDRGAYLKRKVPGLILYATVFVAAAGAVVLLIPWLASNPSVPRSYWLVPIIVVMIVFQTVLWAGPDLSTRRFAVYTDGFSPPYRSVTFTRARFGERVNYSDVARMQASTYMRGGTQGIYAVFVELVDGRRLVIRTRDVGAEGIATLLRAWKESEDANRTGSPAAKHGPEPASSRGDKMRNALGSIAMVVMMLLVALLVLESGTPLAPASIELFGLAGMGAIFAVVLLARSRG